VGRVAEEVSHLKGELNHINEKLQRAYAAYSRMTQGQNVQNWSVQNGKLVVPGAPYNQPPADLDALLDAHQLKEILEKKTETND